MVNLGNDWDEKLAGEFDKPYYKELRKFLVSEYKTKTIYPDMYDIFAALKAAPYSEAKVVILGQDPYHEPGQAHGLCFSVQKGVDIPPSLQNIYKELASDDGCIPGGGSFVIPNHGCLTDWAQQGVVLLNAVLTVRAHAANSHKGMGWETFTDHVIEVLNEHERPLVFILWGANARAKKALIDTKKHLVLEGAHPSPLSAYKGFFGGKYFSKANDFLESKGIKPIDWQIR